MNNTEFTFRLTTEEDLDSVMAIFARARDFMAKTGNPTQWGSKWPPKELILNDIHSGRGMVCECNGEIVGTFSYQEGYDIDPPYRKVEGGSWTKDGEYAVVHRVASSGTVKGVGSACIQYAFDNSRSHHLRMDTHADNLVMQSVLAKNGFSKVGIVYMEKDNSPRIAFEKLK